MPANGSRAARLASDLAFVLAGKEGEVLLLYVTEEDGQDGYNLDPATTTQPRQIITAREIIDELRLIGETQGVKTLSQIQASSTPEAMILEVAAREEVDMIVLGTSVYAASKRVYLGPRVEYILNQASCPVILLNSV